MKQMEFTVKIVTNGSVDSSELSNSILGLQQYDIQRAEITNYRVLPVKKAAKVAS